MISVKMSKPKVCLCRLKLSSSTVFAVILLTFLLEFNLMVSASPTQTNTLNSGLPIFVQKSPTDLGGVTRDSSFHSSSTENPRTDKTLEPVTERAPLKPSAWTPVIIFMLFLVVVAIVAIPAIMVLKKREKLKATKIAIAQVAERTRRFTLTLSPEIKSGFSRMSSSQSSSVSA